MKIVVLEGCDGVGKTAQAFLLTEKLQSQQLRVYRSHEPFGAPIFDNCRFGVKQLLSNPAKRLDIHSEVLLYLMSRLEQIKHMESIEEQHDFAIIDRFSASTLAYQCYGLGMETEVVQLLESLLINQPAVAVTFVLDAEYATVANRINERQPGMACYYESLGKNLFDKVRSGFLEIAADRSDYVVIDANKSRDDVFNDIMLALKERELL